MSNFPFFSKRIEKQTGKEESLGPNVLHVLYQYAYDRGHSTGIGLSKVHIAEAPDKGCMPGLIVIYLSVTVDIINHSMLLKRLEFPFCIKENAYTPG